MFYNKSFSHMSNSCVSNYNQLSTSSASKKSNYNFYNYNFYNYNRIIAIINSISLLYSVQTNNTKN